MDNLRLWRMSARILARYHVRLGLEFLGPLELRKAHKYEFIWRMNDMLAFARECGPNVGLLLDSYAQPRWVRRVVEEIQSSDFAEVALVVLNRSHASSSFRK